MEEKTPLSVFRFVKYTVNDSSMAIKDGNVSNDLRLSLKLDVNVEHENEISTLCITMDLHDANSVLSMHVRMTGYFQACDCDINQKRMFTCMNAPAILFPYIRAYVSCVTAQSGIAPIIIPTVNLQKDGQELLRKISGSDAPIINV